MLQDRITLASIARAGYQLRLVQSVTRTNRKRATFLALKVRHTRQAVRLAILAITVKVLRAVILTCQQTETALVSVITVLVLTTESAVLAFEDRFGSSR